MGITGKPKRGQLEKVFGSDQQLVLAVEALFSLSGFLPGDLVTAALLSGTVTITIANPAVVTWTSHGFNTGDPILFRTTGALPTGLVAGTVYYVKRLTANTFNLSATPNGVNIVTSGTQSGTQTGVFASRAGALVANGQAVSRTLYANLFARIGTSYGVGDGTTTFNLPNVAAVSNCYVFIVY